MRRAPNLARRLVLEEREQVPDGAGGFASYWRPLGALWAELTPRTGREDFVAAQARPRVQWRIVLRASPVGSASRPRPDQRLREGARIFAIQTVAEADAAGRYLEVLAEEGVMP